MRRFISMLFVLLLIVWVICSGIHWASALTLMMISCVGGCIVFISQHPAFARFFKSDAHMPLLDGMAPFQGYGALGWMLIVMILLTLLSLIPLPLSVLDLLSPKSAELYREVDALSGLGNSFTWGFISAAPGRTAYALMMLCGFGGLYIMTSSIAWERAAMNRLIRILTVAALCIVAMLALRYAGINISFGQTGAASPIHIGLPVNPNHTASIMSLVSLMVLGTSFSHRHRDIIARRGIWILIYLIFSFTLIMLKSRGAILGWGLGHLVLFATLWLSKHRVQLKHCILVLACICVVIGAVVFVSAPVISSIKTEFENTEIVFDTSDDLVSLGTEEAKEFSKTQMYGDFWQMSRDWGRMGTGRSAFTDIYPQYQSFPFSKQFRHAENEYWEIVLEYGWFWGLCILILGMLGVVAFFKTFFRASDERASIYGVLAGIIAVLIQNCFDFNLRYWTAAVPFWIACGILEGRRRRWTHGKQNILSVSLNTSQKLQLWVGSVVLVVGIITVIGTARIWHDGITESGIQTYSQAIDKHDNPEKIRQSLVDNLKLRPASTTIRSLTASKLIRDARTLREESERLKTYQNARNWYQSAHQLAPHQPYIMLHLAKLYMATGDEKSAVSLLYRTADENPGLRSLAMHEAAALGDDVLYLPQNMNTLRSLVSSLLNEKRYQTVQELIQQIPADDIEHKAVIAELSYQLYEALGFSEGSELIAQRIRNYPVTPALFHIRAALYLRKQNYTALFTYLEETERALKSSPDYWMYRLFYSVFYGQNQSQEWYRHDVAHIFLEYRKIAPNSAKYRFFYALCDAKYALELGQNYRAMQSASEAKKLRPRHKGAEAIYLEASRRIQQSVSPLGGSSK